MKESLMQIIVCPVCKGSLELNVTEKSVDEIMAGTLFCKKCSHFYPIKDSIPNLLPPNLNG